MTLSSVSSRMSGIPATSGTNIAASNAAAFESLVDEQVVRQAAEDGRTDAIVFFKEAQNQGVSAAMGALELATAMPRGAERKSLVYNAVNQIGTETINERRPVLDSLVENGQVTGVDELWAFNAVRLRGVTTEGLKKIAGTGVHQVVKDEKIVTNFMPNGYTDAVEGAAGRADTDPTKEDPNVVLMDWGVQKMNAPAAWSQGITGAGITIGSLDTGVITDHSGLKNNYRGTKADGTQDHNYNLSNFVEKDATYPVDDVGHGTHTIGSAVGNDKNHLVGVAPDAKFVVGRGLGNAGGSMFGLMAAMQWMMAPTDLKGQKPRPDLAPDIVTNSWGGAPVSNPFLWMALRNWDRAGIIPIFAAGNNRKAVPGQVAVPGMYQEAITIGATEPDDSRAFFSMYGPSDHANGPKPEVVAPGTWTYSTLPDYTFRDTFIIDGKPYPASGTSMATPHVAGAVALYLQAHPNATTKEIRDALQKSGTLAGKPNDEIGHGRVQVEKLIAPGSFDPAKVKLTDPARVAELNDQVSRSKVFSTRPGPKGLQPAKDGGFVPLPSPQPAGDRS